MELKLIFTVVDLQQIFACSQRSAYRIRTAILEKFGLKSSDILTRAHVAAYMNLSLTKFDKMYVKSMQFNAKRKKYR
ncbi:hypothetical protein [Sphingobacterium sp. SGL-16]|uniref:hypothetical protein n=1 Tax=Sphingobacterium sp. SGL-16 TaxID=2710883 RepID=UPI0013E9A9E5|nr:hypothetical protein [Sphingobacterium sp. SGL-16]NGM72225.1 hypothetical protein [Sphingobacterium sp. SGL-16]